MIGIQGMGQGMNLGVPFKRFLAGVIGMDGSHHVEAMVETITFAGVYVGESNPFRACWVVRDFVHPQWVYIYIYRMRKGMNLGVPFKKIARDGL